MTRRELPRDLAANLYSHEHGSIAPPNGLLQFPAITLFPFLRWPIGRHRVNPPGVALVTLLLMLAPIVIEFLYLAVSGRQGSPRLRRMTPTRR